MPALRAAGEPQGGVHALVDRGRRRGLLPAHAGFVPVTKERAGSARGLHGRRRGLEVVNPRPGGRKGGNNKAGGEGSGTEPGSGRVGGVKGIAVLVPVRGRVLSFPTPDND